MAKKKEKKRTATTTLRYIDESNREMFQEAAKKEGFTTTNAWMMFHLLNQARKTLDSDK